MRSRMPKVLTASFGAEPHQASALRAPSLCAFENRMNRKHKVYKSQLQDGGSCYINRLSLPLAPYIGGTAVRRMLAFAAVGLAALLGGCVQDGLLEMPHFQLKPDDIILERRPGVEYEKLFPYYV